MKISRYDIMDALLYADIMGNKAMYNSLLLVINNTNPKDEYGYIGDEEILNFINEALRYRYNDKPYNNILDYYDDLARKKQQETRKSIGKSIKAKIKRNKN